MLAYDEFHNIEWTYFQGMGGQFEYFGLWLDSEYGHGHSKAEPTCTTFNSVQLSAKPHFGINTVEVWGVGPDKRRKRKQDEVFNAPNSLIGHLCIQKIFV